MTYTHEFNWKVHSAPDKAFEALTDPAALQTWFAEHVEIDRREGGSFRFWGKHTLGTPMKEQAMQEITEFEPPNKFGFTWQILGVSSDVTFEISENGEEGWTTIAGSHRFASDLEGVRSHELIDDLWRLNNGNLMCFLTGTDGFLLPDYEDTSPEITLSVLIDAPRADVFKALITPEILAKWLWAENAEVEPRADGKYSLGWHYEVNGQKVHGGPTKIIEYVENEKLVTDWPDWRGDSSVPVQTVAWVLSDEGSGTRVTLTHAGFIRPTDISDYPFGWADFVGQLKATVEGN